MVEKLKNLISRCYLGLILLFLYAPILVLIVLSFNNSRSRVQWGGFTLDWYSRLFSNRQIMEALSTTLTLAFSSALIATVIGVLGALGIHAMRRKNYQLVMVCTNIPLLNAVVAGFEAGARYGDRNRIDALVCEFHAAWIWKCSSGTHYI